MENQKQREKSVINIVLGVLFIATFSVDSYSQHVGEGKFCKVYEIRDYGKCLKFNADSSFEYIYSGDLGRINYGGGYYKFINKKLILNYNKTQPLEIGYHTTKIWTNNKDSITVVFKLLDFNKNPIPYAQISYKDSLSSHGYGVHVVNKPEPISIKLERENKMLEFQISSMDYSIMSSLYHSIYKLEIHKIYNYEIIAYMPKSTSGIPILNQIDTLEIVKRKPKYFVVKNKNGSTTRWNRLED